MRQIVLDTETTGIDPNDGHRIIEIGCVELVGRKLTGRHFHRYINPEREVEAGAIEVHGITNEMLADKPLFSAVARNFSILFAAPNSSFTMPRSTSASSIWSWLGYRAGSQSLQKSAVWSTPWSWRARSTPGSGIAWMHCASVTM
jgi:hypothetical protein